MMRVFWFVLIGVVLVVGGVLGFRYLRPLPVSVVRVATGKAMEAVYASGTVEAKERVTIRSKIAGSIVSLVVSEGEYVKLGQLIASIDAPSLQFDVRKGQADLFAASQRFQTKPQLQQLRSQARSLSVDIKQAEMDLKRTKDLLQSGGTTTQDVEKAQNKLDAAKAQLDANLAAQRDTKIGIVADLKRQKANVSSLQAKATDAEIHAPLEGIVLSRKVELGETVGVNQELLRIGDVRHLWIEAQVGEEDIGRLRTGMKAIVRFYAFGQKTFSATIQRIFPDANRDLKSFEVDLELDVPVSGLLSGMTCEIDMIVQEKEKVLLVPVDAITNQMVWVVKDGRAHKQKVTLGIQDLQRVEVLDGLSEGDLVIVGVSAEQSIDGKRVKETELPSSGKS